LVLLVWRGTVAVAAGLVAAGSGQPCAAAAAPVGLPPGRARAKLPPVTASPPGEIVAMAPAAIYSYLVGDSYTQVAIDQELADMGARPDEGGSTFAVMAAAMLVETCGGKAEASAFAARWTRKITARSARAVSARDAGAA
jgi:hypothetical protein